MCWKPERLEATGGRCHFICSAVFHWPFQTGQWGFYFIIKRKKKDQMVHFCIYIPTLTTGARLLTVLSAFNVVSSREAARHPSSVEPPSHIPAKAAMLLWTQRTITRMQTTQPTSRAATIHIFATLTVLIGFFYIIYNDNTETNSVLKRFLSCCSYLLMVLT